jgi:hypothetical protein
LESLPQFIHTDHHEFAIHIEFDGFLGAYAVVSQDYA